jgi:hypothetical protein
MAATVSESRLELTAWRSVCRNSSGERRKQFLELLLHAVDTQKKEGTQSRIDILRVCGSEMSDVIGNHANWRISNYALYRDRNDRMNSLKSISANP